MRLSQMRSTPLLQLVLCALCARAASGAMVPFAGLQLSRGGGLLPEITEPLQHAVKAGTLEPHAASEITAALLDADAASQARVYKEERRAAKERTALAFPQRRQLQEVIDTVDSETKAGWTAAMHDGLWGYLPDPEGGFDQPSSVCNDPQAVNAGQAGASACVYDCDQLLALHFGGVGNDGKNKCFVYDESSNGWWENGAPRPGEEADKELIASRRTSKVEWWQLLEPTDGLGDIPEFTVGEGRVCRNVTVLNSSDPVALTAALAEDPEGFGDTGAGNNETACLLDGVHHAAGFTHFAVDGEESFAPVCMPGDTVCSDMITVGECTDVIIRVTTSASFVAGPDVVWSLSCGEDCHMGPWTHTCSGEDCAGVHEYYACLFDNHYALELVSTSAGWSGLVTVVTYVPDNSIEVPQDENWIIQGASTNGVPVELDARIFTGNPWALSNASIVMRHIRLSGQQGTLDPYWGGGPLEAARTISGRPFARQGGAFYYEGGFGSTLSFDHVVMDHNGAESCGGGAGVLIGRAERFTPEMCTSGVPEETWSSSIAESFDDIASKGRCSIIPGTSTRSCPKPKPGATQVTAFPPAANVAGCGTSISITGSLFWANTGFAVGGIRGFNTFWSATYAGNSWVDNDAVVGHDHGFWNVVPGNFGEKLYSFVDEIYVHTEHCTEDAYRNPYGKGVFCNSGLCTGPTFYTFAGGGALQGEDNSITVYHDNVEIKDAFIWYCPMGLQGFQLADGVVRIVWVRPSMSNNAGSFTINMFQVAWLYMGVANPADPPEETFSHGLWDGNFITEGSEVASASGGAHLHLMSYGSSVVEYCAFTNGRATLGGAIYIMGTGSLSIVQSSFIGNVAVSAGGAVTFASNGARLMIESSIFLGNIVEPPFGGEPKPPVFIRVHTGSTGVPPGTTPVAEEMFGYSMPVFKIDGAEPYTVCNGIPAGCGPHAETPELRVCDVPPRSCDPGQKCSSVDRSMYPASYPDIYPWAVVPGANCFDGDVPIAEKIFGGNRTGTNDTPFMEQYSDYSEVVNLSPGTHTLWYGIRVDTNEPPYGWPGFGWIDIVGIVDPIYPSLFDYRGTNDVDNANGYDQPGYSDYKVDSFCWGGSAATSLTELCEKEHTLWRKVEFEVPFGEGGAIKSTGSGSTIVIVNSTFDGNQAGSGTVLLAVGASQVVLKDSHQQPGDTVASTTAVSQCSAGACDPGQQCSLSDAGVAGYFCNEPCAINAYGNGYECISCGSGTEPGCTGDIGCSQPDTCVPCAPNEVSTVGICSACAAGYFPSADKTACVPCPAGEILIADGSACQACPAGTSNRDDGLGCESCAASGPNKYSLGGGGACADCIAGTQPNAQRSACEQCSAGLYSTAASVCQRCAVGQEHVNRIVCNNCPVGKHNTGELEQCAPCNPGEHPNTDRTACESCLGEGRHKYSSVGAACLACPAGTQPNANATACDECPLGTVRGGSDADICAPCAAGQSPSATRAECLPCPVGTYSPAGGECTTCEPGSQPNADQSGCESCAGYVGTFSADGSACVACSNRQSPSPDRASCVCQSGTYNYEEVGKISCHGIGEAEDFDVCVTCPHCLDCTGGEPLLLEGWAFFGQGDAYECPAKDQYGQRQGCPGGPLPNRSVAAALWFVEPFTEVALDTQCSVGYTGPICGTCKPGWSHLKVGTICSSCDGNTFNVGAMLVGLALVLGLGTIVVSGAITWLQDYGLLTDMRIIVGFYQVLAQLSNVMDITFPEPVPTFASYLTLLMVDARTMINLDCWNIGGFYAKLTTNLLVIPLLFIAVCGFIWSSQKRTIAQVIAAGGADESAYVTANVKLQQNLFFTIFLLYPMFTTTLFRVPQCREIGDRWFHEEDYNVECDSGFSGVVAFAILMIVVVPVGVPLVSFIGMKRAKDSLGGARMTALGGAKLSGDEVRDDDDRFGFLIKDLKPEFWYYEIVIYSRKLLLGGLSVILGRGTMAQAYFVASVEAVFLMHHFRSYPYLFHKHNVLDGFGHLALVLTYMVTLILRHGEGNTDAWRDEFFPRDGYGYFIVFMYSVVLPSPSIYYYFKHRTGIDRVIETDVGEEWEFDNPLGGELEDATESELPAGSDKGAPGKAGPLEASEPAQNAAFSPAAVSRLNRIANENRIENEVLTRQVVELTEANEQLRTSVIVSGGDVGAVAEPMQKSKSKSKNKSNADVEPEPMKAAAPPVDPQQAAILAMKVYLEDESVSEENRAAAKEAIDARVTSSIEMEVDNVALQKLQRRIQQEDSVEMLNKARLESVRKRNATAFEKVHDARTQLRSWLGEIRLIAHEQQFLDVCGVDMAVSDLRFCRQEDIDALAEPMSWIESQRLTEAIEAMKAQASD